MTSTEQLERETEQTRLQLAATLDELKSMTPGRVLDEVMDYAKANGSDFFRNLGHQISEKPLPATLIGAGIAWFIMANGSSSRGSASRMRANGNGQNWGDKSWSDSASELADSAYETGSEWSDKAGSAIRSAKDTAKSAAHGVSSAASSASSTLSDAASSLKDSAASAYDTMADTANRTASTVKNAASSAAESAKALEQSAMAATRNMFDFAKDQPLVLAGLGLAIGAALGAAIPETETEDRLMGETADQVKEKAQQLASEQLDIAKKVGQHIVEEAKDVGQHLVDETKTITQQNVASLMGDGQAKDELQKTQSQMESGDGQTMTPQADQQGDSAQNQPGTSGYSSGDLSRPWPH